MYYQNYEAPAALQYAFWWGAQANTSIISLYTHSDTVPSYVVCGYSGGAEPLHAEVVDEAEPRQHLHARVDLRVRTGHVPICGVWI